LLKSRGEYLVSKLIVKVLLVFCFLFSLPTYSSELKLGGYSSNNGFDGDETALKIISMGAYSLDSYILYPSSGIYFVLMGDVFGKIDLKKKEYLGEVPLDRWPTEYSDKAISDLYEHRYIYSERSHELYDQYYSANPTTSGSSKAVGCLGEKPLRYGDVDDNGTKEIVLYLSDFNNKSDWIIFSPEKEKIIFSMRWQVRDYYEGKADGYGKWPIMQYPSEEDQRGSSNTGFQVYAKAFLGDFNKDKIPDILVWRKRFESLATGVSKKGFELKGEHFEHYSLVDGEYQPQVTIPLQIKDWLADAELTWSKGYLSKSECEGQEGQLIPEMHDPLLNDPDVLK
jgi:hypothetical protein